MNPVKQIGRYQIPIADIVIVQKRTGLKALFLPGYDVLMCQGVKIRLNDSEMDELNREREIHEKTIEVLYQVAGMQRNNRAASA